MTDSSVFGCFHNPKWVNVDGCESSISRGRRWNGWVECVDSDGNDKNIEIDFSVRHSPYESINKSTNVSNVNLDALLMWRQHIYRSRLRCALCVPSSADSSSENSICMHFIENNFYCRLGCLGCTHVSRNLLIPKMSKSKKPSRPRWTHFDFWQIWCRIWSRGMHDRSFVVVGGWTSIST